MYPLKVKGEKADHESAELEGFVEKQETRRRTPRFFLVIRSLLVLAAVLVAFDYFSSFLLGRTRPIQLCTKGKDSHDKVDFNTVDYWNTVPVSWYQHKDILWKDCYGEKQCARFAVPLDYLDESQDGPWATIALVRVPAKVSPESPAYKGPILFNPGGPGGSGVALIVQLGNTFQQVLGPEFDIVGFDPRGVGFTTPSLSVFDDQAEEVAWVLRETTAPLWNSSSDAVAKLHTRATVINKLVSDRAGHTAAYASTASVSRDMLEITRAHGRDKLQYWGFSYGSILGATYAAMFPNNVGRLIIDGVMDTKNYYDTLWSKNLVDTEAGLKLFFEGCVEAGPELCGLYESTTEKVQARYENILNNLKRRPLAVPTIGQDSTAIDYGVIDYTLVKSLVFLFLYSPYARTPDAGSAASHLSFRLSEVEKGEGLPLWNAIKYGLPRFECTRRPHATLAPVATSVIACGDGKAVNDSVDELEEFFYELNSTFADVWPIRARCSNWKVKPKYRFTGPFGGNTSYPLLIVGNTADPVTPLSSAHSVSRDFNNSSVVLTQNSAGHCSIAALSICSAKAIRSYLRDGILPKQGTVCETEAKIFGGKDSSLLNSLSAEEQGLVEGWSELQEAFSMPGFGLVQSQLRGL